LLLGARQVGKSTLTRSLSPDLVLNLADESLYLSYAKDPGRLRREVDALKRPSLIVLDEVQRVPSLLNTVQAILDDEAKRRFILTGSSARKLKRGARALVICLGASAHIEPKREPKSISSSTWESEFWH
jgi:predicted AAA+ superfamily ATPase